MVSPEHNRTPRKLFTSPGDLYLIAIFSTEQRGSENWSDTGTVWMENKRALPVELTGTGTGPVSGPAPAPVLASWIAITLTRNPALQGVLHPHSQASRALPAGPGLGGAGAGAGAGAVPVPYREESSKT